jgi:hypothetical protein
MFIPDPDPGSDFFPSRIRIVSSLDPGSASKNLSLLTKKNGFLALGNISVADRDLGSGIRCLFDPWIRDQDPGWVEVRIRIGDPG